MLFREQGTSSAAGNDEQTGAGHQGEEETEVVDLSDDEGHEHSSHHYRRLTPTSTTTKSISNRSILLNRVTTKRLHCLRLTCGFFESISYSDIFSSGEKNISITTKRCHITQRVLYPCHVFQIENIETFQIQRITMFDSLMTQISLFRIQSQVKYLFSQFNSF